MKSPTKRIFYHLEVTRGTFNTEMPIRARLHMLPAHRCARPHLLTCKPAARPHLLPCKPAARPHLPTCKPAVRPRRCAQKSLVAERYQAFSEAKCLS